MSNRPVRVIRARDLVKGATVLTKCISPAQYCDVPARHHGTAAQPARHERTLLDAETHDGRTTAICVSEDGEPCDLRVPEYQTVRVYADTVPGTGPEPEP